MKIVILGAGVIGVSTAYMLGARGHEVEVIERNAASGLETSFANGGQLSFSHAEPWANPQVLSKIIKWSLRDDSPLVLRPRADIEMLKWGLRFLANCTESRAKTNSMNTLKLGMYSKKKMEWFRNFSGVKFDNIREGILHIFTDEKEMEGAIKQATFQHKFGCPSDILDAAKTIQMEPALAHSTHPVKGGIHESLDESGDIFTFTQGIAALCESDFNAQFHYDTAVQSIETEKGKITGIKTDKGIIKGDVYIMSLGSYTPIYLKPLGIHVPIYPMKGYSVTFPVNHYSPTMSLTDTANKIVYSRLGNRLRVAGTAEFAGYNTEIKPHRIDPIVRAVKTLLPKCEYDKPESEWACLRPSTPDGPPVIGKTKYPNLYMNTGHGTLGWTHAAGSAALIADIIEGRPTEISMDGLTLDRF